jgi:hypothetical protein
VRRKGTDLELVFVRYYHCRYQNAGDTEARALHAVVKGLHALAQAELLADTALVDA